MYGILGGDGSNKKGWLYISFCVDSQTDLKAPIKLERNTILVRETKTALGSATESDPSILQRHL